MALDQNRYQNDPAYRQGVDDEREHAKIVIKQTLGHLWAQQTQWKFDYAALKRTNAEENFPYGRDVPTGEYMARIGRFIVDGPQDVDWGDRYGWVVLTMNQLVQLAGDFLN